MTRKRVRFTIEMEPDGAPPQVEKDNYFCATWNFDSPEEAAKILKSVNSVAGLLMANEPDD